MLEELSRRQFVAILAGTAGGAWLAAHSRELLAIGAEVSALTDAELQTFKVLTPAAAMDLEAATSLIVPTDETPGAREARVVHFIDRSLGTFASDQRSRVDGVVEELRKRARRRNASSFAALREADQVRILEDMERDEADKFDVLRSLTIVGMLSNPGYGGNHEKVGWKWIGFVDQFSWVAPFGWYDRNEK